MFWKVQDYKEIQNLKSWFVGYFEFALPLTEAIVTEYEAIFHDIRQREIVSLQEKMESLEAITRINLDHIKFKNQFFKKEDYLAFTSIMSRNHSEAMKAERERIASRLTELHNAINSNLKKLRLYRQENRVCSSDLEPKISEQSIAYADDLGSPIPFIEIKIRRTGLSVGIVMGTSCGERTCRERFKELMLEEPFRKNFFGAVLALNAGYQLQVAGETREITSFQDEQQLWNFTKADHDAYFFGIFKLVMPGDAALSSDNITGTLLTEIEKLHAIYRHVNQV